MTSPEPTLPHDDDRAPSAEAVDARLRTLAALSAATPVETYTTVDMSEAAIEGRLRDWAEISALALDLAAAGAAAR